MPGSMSFSLMGTVTNESEDEGEVMVSNKAVSSLASRGISEVGDSKALTGARSAEENRIGATLETAIPAAAVVIQSTELEWSS